MGVDLLLDYTLLPANSGSGSNTRKTSLTYDSSNRLTEVHRDITSSTQELRVKYAYTEFSQLESLTRLKGGVERAFTFTYDIAGRPASATDPLTNAGAMAYEPFCKGNTQTSARGVRRRTDFDARCLMTQFEVGDVDSTDPLEVLNARETRTFEYDELGRMVSSLQTGNSRYGKSVAGLDAYGANEKRLYLYDELDRVVEMRFRTDGDTAGTNDKIMSYEYDDEGNVTKVTDTEGNVTNYEYFRDNLLHKVIIERPSESDRVFVYSYDAAGQPATIPYPTATGLVAKFEDDSATADSGWDANGRLLNLRYEKSSTLVRRLEFAYDDSGNRTSQLDVTPTAAVKWEYDYDWLDRLVTVKRATAATVAALPATTLQREYVFDESDNRTFFDDHVNGDTYHYKYKSYNDGGTVRYSDVLDEILIYTTAAGHRTVANFTSLETFEHDADGNMTKRIKTGDTVEFVWDDFDRMSKATSTANGRLQDNRYDVNGIRKRKLDKSGNSSVEYTAGIVTSTSDAGSGSSSAPTISYLQGPNGILGAEVDGEFIYHLGDALGTVRDIWGYNSGTSLWEVVKSFEFDEYGNELSATGSGTASPKTWIGGLSVNDDTDDSGLFMMGHRYYAGGYLGRFINRDPIGFAGGLNLFSYANNNPVNLEWSGSCRHR